MVKIMYFQTKIRASLSFKHSSFQKN